MTTPTLQELMAQLSRPKSPAPQSGEAASATASTTIPRPELPVGLPRSATHTNPTAAVERLLPAAADEEAAAAPAHPPALPASAPLPPDRMAPPDKDEKLDELLCRINLLTGQPASDKKKSEGPAPAAGHRPFLPLEPGTFQEAQLNESEVEALILKYLLAASSAAGRAVADQVTIPFKLVDGLLFQMKTDQLVVYRGSAPMNDYVYQLTDIGRERARRLAEHCTYFGAAPVCLQHYIDSVGLQSLVTQQPTMTDLRQAFTDLLLPDRMLNRLGPAINSGRGLFLYGAPGNGKTSIAERITKAFGDAIWIPRALSIDGEVIRLFDPSNHEPLPLEPSSGLLDTQRIDKRWIRIRRPTIVVGGELTMNSLEVTLNTSTGISEAPLQLKSNCGTLVIDDFGRQRMSTDELLNRWIVPLEKRYDFLNLSNGKKIQVPFDQLIVFSTNLEPRDLVDDAFLRRIPYKINVDDPTEAEFRSLFELMAPKLGFQFNGPAVDHLIEKHYKAVGRPLRCCQPRDLLLQVRNYCRFTKQPMEMTPEYFDFAVENYFAVM